MDKLDKGRRSDVFHRDPPEAAFVSRQHNGVARIVLTCEFNCPFGMLLHCRDDHPSQKFGLEIKEIHMKIHIT